MYRNIILLLLVLLVSCHQKERAVDPKVKAEVDALNKEAFMNRYTDPLRGAHIADSLLDYMDDSVIAYPEGYMRARNIRDFCYFMVAQFPTDSHLFDPHASTFPVESAIAQLLEARTYQRECNTAESYRLLYEVEHSGLLDKEQDNYIYSYAKSEYYITQLILNYHYRNGSHVDGEMLLQEIEEQRRKLKVDYAQDMALNYAMAHSYFKLSTNAVDSMQTFFLKRALELCADNLTILSSSHYGCDYQLANTFQLMAFMLSDPSIDTTAWANVALEIDELLSFMGEYFGFYPSPDMDLALSLFEESAAIFWQLDDPYQRMGASIATAGWALQLGDTAVAHYYYGLILADSTMPENFAPKFEAILYDGLIRSRYPGSAEDYLLWYDRSSMLKEIIAQNQRADFELQHQLEESQTTNRNITITLVIILVLMVALIVALLLLRHRTRALAKETRRLEEAKQKDIERIANVETCLSVLRHDITPFFSYLQNRKLPEALREEILDQLVRTFDNIKSWTTLSAPTGIRFHPSNFMLSDTFREVESHVVNLHPDKVKLTFGHTDHQVWADPKLLVILLRNLVTNALQHTEEGSVIVSAETYADDQRLLQITVSDSGTGMNSEALEELFRSDKKPSSNGHGFGLILSRYIIKQHDDNTLRGCRIWAESKEGEGTKFHFLIAQSQDNR